MKINNILNINTNKFIYETDELIVANSINDICFIELKKDNIVLNTKIQQFEIAKESKYNLQLLTKIGFIQIHPKYMINKNFIVRFSLKEMKIDLFDCVSLPVHPDFERNVEIFLNSIH